MPAEALDIFGVSGHQELSFRAENTGGLFRRLPAVSQVTNVRGWESVALSSLSFPTELEYTAGTSYRTFSGEEQANMSALYALYDVSSRAQVDAFFLDHKWLIDIVLQAHEQIVQHFGENPHVTLSVEPGEHADEPPELWAEIETTLPVDDAYDKLQEITRSWYAARADQLLGCFHFDLEFA